jgi:osmotically-inducible protein OsmY
MIQPMKKPDAQIQRDVLDELRWDARVRETDVGVEVSDGIVTLTGTLDTWTARVAAQEAAHRVQDVLDVANDIRVKPQGSLERTDTEIAKAVREALERDVLVDDECIHTTVSGGVVTLEGVVQSWTQHEDVCRAIRNLAGVREVRNLIAVEPPSIPTIEIRDAIEAALERHAIHAGKHVQVAVEDGKVILTGEAPSWAERNAIVGAVKGTPGVRKVENRLRIRA